MKLEALQNAIGEVQRFLHTAVQAKVEIQRKTGNKKQAACRRASMDLSRSLSELRRFKK